jgi:hypothetical protein
LLAFSPNAAMKWLFFLVLKALYARDPKDAERAANIRKLAREVEASNDPALLDSALRKIVQRRPEPVKPNAAEK